MSRFPLRGLVQGVMEFGLSCTRDFEYSGLSRNQMPMIDYKFEHGYSINGGDVMQAAQGGPPLLLRPCLAGGSESCKFASALSRQGFSVYANVDFD